MCYNNIEEEVAVKWNYDNICLTKLGRYIVTSNVIISDDYILSEGLSDIVSFDLIIISADFIIEQINPKENGEHYYKDTIVMSLSEKGGLISDVIYDEKNPIFDEVIWNISDQENVYFVSKLYELENFKEVYDIKSYIHILKDNFEFAVSATIVYQGLEFDTNEIIISVSKHESGIEDLDSIYILCGKEDLKYLDPFNDEYVYYTDLKSARAVYLHAMNGKNDIKFILYPDDVDTEDEKVNYIIDLYEKGIMNFDCIFMTSNMTKMILSKK